MIFLRSTIFNLTFYGATAIACILCLPGLLLPRKGAFIIIRGFTKTVHFLEKYILGLDYEVRGLEHIPKDGSYIIAAKHQSPYETLKLHILFDFPAVVLKQELLRIPLWGWFLNRSEPIAIDRSRGKQASQQIVDASLEVEKQNRPIIIFPQGTRVYPWETSADKPYKPGVVKIYEATDMPIVPLALNSGLFWPRKSWIKRPGKVVFHFLEPISSNQEGIQLLAELEKRIEEGTINLEREALSKNKFLLTPEQMKEQS